MRGRVSGQDLVSRAGASFAGWTSGEALWETGCRKRLEFGIPYPLSKNFKILQTKALGPDSISKIFIPFDLSFKIFHPLELALF
jgi:hypothetical protein